MMVIAIYSLLMMVGTAVFVYGSYLGFSWFLGQPFSYLNIIQWIGFIACMALITGGVSYILPETWHVCLDIVLSHLGCILACHMLFLRIQTFATLYGKKSYPWLWNIFLVLMYGALSFSAMFFVQAQSLWMVTMGQAGIDYLMRTAILFTLLLEIRARTIDAQPPLLQHDNEPSDQYENYENQW